MKMDKKLIISKIPEALETKGKSLKIYDGTRYLNDILEFSTHFKVEKVNRVFCQVKEAIKLRVEGKDVVLLVSNDENLAQPSVEELVVVTENNGIIPEIKEDGKNGEVSLTTDEIKPEDSLPKVEEEIKVESKTTTVNTPAPNTGKK